MEELSKSESFYLRSFESSDVENAITCFDTVPGNSNSENLGKVFVTKVIVEQDFGPLSSNDLKELTDKCMDISIVIFFVSRSEKSFSIYWKSKEIQHLLTFKPYDSDYCGYNKMMYEYIVKFLTESLENGHLGKLNLKK
jgi:hypothetical protein